MKVETIALICEGEEPSHKEPLTLELPLTVMFRGRAYRLQATKKNGGLILTRHPDTPSSGEKGR